MRITRRSALGLVFGVLFESAPSTCTELSLHLGASPIFTRAGLMPDAPKAGQVFVIKQTFSDIDPDKIARDFFALLNRDSFYAGG